MTRILSVEDDPDLQQMLSLALTNEGFSVHYAFTGTEGYEKALDLLPSVVICDLMMPGMNGPELIAKLKTHPATQDIPVVVTTAYSDAPGMVESKVRPLGIVEYLRKPVRLEELVRVLKRLLAQAPERPPPQRAPGAARGRLRLDAQTRAVWVDDRLAATLTRRRFALLSLLVSSAGPVARQTLMAELWGACATRARLDKMIQRLREDLGEAGGLLRTTAGGYEIVN